MDKIQEQLEKLDRLHKTKRRYVVELIVNCLSLALIISSYVISIIVEDIVCISILSVILGIILFLVLNTMSMLIAVRKKIIEETDKTCEQLKEKSQKMFMMAFEQIEKELAKMETEEDKVEADKKIVTEKKPIKKANTTSSVKKKAGTKKVSKNKN